MIDLLVITLLCGLSTRSLMFWLWEGGMRQRLFALICRRRWLSDADRWKLHGSGQQFDKVLAENFEGPELLAELFGCRYCFTAWAAALPALLAVLTLPVANWEYVPWLWAAGAGISMITRPR